MENAKHPLLQTRAVTKYFQTGDWNGLHETDFIVVMPIPHFNKLKKPVTLPFDRFHEMEQKTFEYLEMWRNMKDYGVKPWEIRGAVYGEDLRAMHMLDTLQRDADIYRERKRIQDQKNQDYINEQRALHQRAANRRR